MGPPPVSTNKSYPVLCYQNTNIPGIMYAVQQYDILLLHSSTLLHYHAHNHDMHTHLRSRHHGTPSSVDRQ